MSNYLPFNTLTSRKTWTSRFTSHF